MLAIAETQIVSEEHVIGKASRMLICDPASRAAYLIKLKLRAQQLATLVLNFLHDSGFPSRHI